MWMDAIYEPGEVKVVAYDKNGKAVAEKVYVLQESLITSNWSATVTN